MKIKSRSIKKSKKENEKSSLFFIADFIFLISAILIVLLTETIQQTNLLGFYVISISIYLIIKFKKSSKLLMLFSILAFINISIAYTDIINLGINVAPWQIEFRLSEYNLYTMKSLVLFLAVLNIILSNKFANSLANNNNFMLSLKYNPYIVISLIFVLYLILFFAYDPAIRGSVEYVSNQNPLYEYAIVLFLIAWLYTGNNKILKYNLVLFSIVYILNAFSTGDRSAAFVMVLIVVLSNFANKVNIKIISLGALSSIILANTISYLRINNSVDLSSILDYLINQGLYSDTVSYSYYAAITVSALYHINPDPMMYFFSFIEYQLLGFGVNEFGNFANYVSDNYSILFNRSGGLYFSTFYAMFGYTGVIISSILLGFIIRASFKSNSTLAVMYQILIIGFSLRWYLYNPTGFYRSIFVISTIFYFSLIVINLILMKRKKINE